MTQDFEQLETQLRNLRQVYRVEPREMFWMAAKGRLIARLNEIQVKSKAHLLVLGWLLKPKVAAAFLTTMVIVTGGVGIAVSSEQTIPGESLYGVKRMKENLLVVTTADEEDKVELKLEITRRRAEELTELVEVGSAEDVGNLSEEISRGVTESRSAIAEIKKNEDLKKIAEDQFEKGKKLLEEAAKKAEGKSREEVEKALIILGSDGEDNDSEKKGKFDEKGDDKEGEVKGESSEENKEDDGKDKKDDENKDKDD